MTRRRLTTGVTLVVLVLVLCGMAVWGYHAATAPLASSSAGPTTPTPTCNSQDQKVSRYIRRSDVTVSVYNSGKRSEPVLFALSMVRALNATVTDHPFLSDLTANMGQRVFYPGSVFSYYSPGYKVRNTGTPPLGGPEFQTLTTVTAVRPYSDYGALAFRGRESVESHPKAAAATDYRPLVTEILKFFQTGKPPVSNQETLEIFAFMDAAQRSKEQGGKPVALR